MCTIILQNPEDVGESVKTALSLGYRHLDCAYLCKNEKEIGEALAGQLTTGGGTIDRTDLFVTSKVCFLR